MTSVVNINDVLDGHVSLKIDCIDRLLLNAYVPNLQVGGQVVTFLTGHLGFPVPSPALLEKIGNRFRREVKAFAAEHDVPVLTLKKPDRTRWDDRKLDHVRPYLERAEAEHRTGVVAIVQAQEFQWVFSAKNRSSTPGLVSFDFVKEERRVGIHYFYVLDAEFGPGFIKICTYFPYPSKVWLNGHEWAKRQARREGLSFGELANGFSSCEDPQSLQAICDQLGPRDIEDFFARWTAVIPTPFTDADREAGCFFELSMRQVAVSRTLVFDDPRRARGFFESLVTDNIGIGRPHEVHAVFGRDRRGRTTAQPFATRVFSPGTEVKMDFRYKNSRVKIPERREGAPHRDRHQQAVRHRRPRPTRTSSRARGKGPPGQQPSAYDQTCRPGLCHRLCALRAHPPALLREGQRTGAFRFGDQRAMALVGALCLVVHAITGFTNKSLRGQVAGLLGRDYSSSQMSYDLRRLRLHGLIARNTGTNSYALTPDGIRVAVFYTKLETRLLRPLLEADKPPAPAELRRALATVERVLTDYVTNARLGVAA
jgi:hypothetical protein